MRAHCFCKMSFMDAWRWKTILSLLQECAGCGITQWAEWSDTNSEIRNSQVSKVTLRALAGKETKCFKIIRSSLFSIIHIINVLKMLELLYLSFRKTLHQRNHEAGHKRMDPPKLEMGIPSSAVREPYFEISIFTYLDKRNNMISAKSFGFMDLFFLPNQCGVFHHIFFYVCRNAWIFHLSWEMWIPNSFTVWSLFGFQAYRSLSYNHMAYKCIQRMRAKFSDTGKIITPFDVWLLTPIKQNSLLNYLAVSLKQRAWRPWYVGKVKSKTSCQ